MGLGAIITLGEGNTPLDADLAGAIAEVRVEQTLDGPSRFAIRFIDDIQDGRLKVANDDRLAIDTVLGVSVEVGGQLVCLIRGPITDQRSSMRIGGPGSAFDVKGLSRLDLLDRQCVRAAWTGRASDVARSILSASFDSVDVEETPRIYEEGRETLNQRSTDLEFLTRIARLNNLRLWVSYEASRSPLGAGLSIAETAHLASSPRRPQGALGAIAGAISLVPTSALELRVHTGPDQRPNVTAFEVDIDSRRPSRFVAGSMAREDAEPVTTQATDPQPASGAGTRRLDTLGGTQRELCMPGSGDPQDTQSRGEAALTEAGFFVRATASTSSDMLGGVLQAHDVVSAVGVGPRLGRTAFRVRSATHVITPAHQLADLQLDSNSLGDG